MTLYACNYRPESNTVLYVNDSLYPPRDPWPKVVFQCVLHKYSLMYKNNTITNENDAI